MVQRSFTGTELVELGLTRNAIAHRVATGSLLRVRRDLFRTPDLSFGDLVDLELRAAGEAAVVVGAAAATLRALDGFCLGDEGAGGPVEVAVPKGRNARPGVRRVGDLARDTELVGGRPVLSVGRLLADLGRVAGADLVERAVECALRRGDVGAEALYDPATVRNRHGGGVLAGRPIDLPATGSDAETRFAQLVRSAGVRAPERQVGLVVAGHRRRLDFAWRPEMVAFEVDSRRWHGAERAELDARRHNEISLHGWLVMRVTWFDVVHQPDHVLDLVARALTAGQLGGLRFARTAAPLGEPTC